MLTTSIPLKVCGTLDAPSPTVLEVELAKVLRGPTSVLTGKQPKPCQDWIQMSHWLSHLSCSHSPKAKKKKKNTGRHWPRRSSVFFGLTRCFSS